MENGEVRNAIVIEGLVKRFGSVTALAGLDLAIPEGALAGLIGPNGAGKTTTFSVLCGFLRADAGRCEVMGIPTGDRARLAGIMSATPQDAAMFPNLRADEALAYLAALQGIPKAGRGEAVTAAIEAASLQEHRRKRVRELSHGTRKRLEIAQALLGDPALILFDEPTSGLDPRNAYEIRRLIVSLHERRTIVVSSHNLAELQDICTYAVIIDRGKTVQAGPIGTLTGADRAIIFEFEGEAPGGPLLGQLASVRGITDVVQGPGVLSLVFDPDVAEASAVIRDAGKVLLAAGLVYTGVRRGATLEQKFLEVTKDDAASRDHHV